MAWKLLLFAATSGVLIWSAAAQTSGRSDTPVSDSSQTSSGTSSSLASSGTAAPSTFDRCTTLTVVLSKPVDSRKTKPGDEVSTKLAQEVIYSRDSRQKVVLRKGDKLIGHVTEATAKDEGKANPQSTLGIAFDHAVSRKREQVPVHAVIQELDAPEHNTAAPRVERVTGLSPTGREVVPPREKSGGVTSIPMPTLRGVELVNSTQGTLITSTGKSVKLDRGTQM